MKPFQGPVSWISAVCSVRGMTELHTTEAYAVTHEMRMAAEALIRSLQEAFNAHDPVAISEHYAEEAALGTVMGQELSGRAEVAQFASGIIESFANSYARYDITRLVALAPDVVAVRAIQTPVDVDGIEVDEPKAAGLWVVAQRGSQWKIVAQQHTFLPDEQPDD
jgi:uncharacterized protein (TIGR02246 family)